MRGTLRRLWGVVAGTAVAVLMTHAATSAALLANKAPRYDFASALMLSVFGETTDANASFFAQNGDRISESPFHELAFRVAPPTRFLTAQVANVTPAIPLARLSLASLGGDSTVLSQAVSEGLAPASGYTAVAPAGNAQQVSGPLTFTDTPTYRPLPPVPAISPASGTFAFDAPSTGGQDSAGSLSLPPDRPLTLSGNAPDLAAPAFNAPSDDLPNLALNDRAALSGSLAMPQLHRVTLNVNDDTQHPYGTDALVGVPNLGPTPNLYAGKLTYQIPSLSSTLSVSAYQERLGQNVLPPNAYTNNGGDVNFTVKF